MQDEADVGDGGVAHVDVAGIAPVDLDGPAAVGLLVPAARDHREGIVLDRLSCAVQRNRRPAQSLGVAAHLEHVVDVGGSVGAQRHHTVGKNRNRQRPAQPPGHRHEVRRSRRGTDQPGRRRAPSPRW
jgi:hypothetical protein